MADVERSIAWLHAFKRLRNRYEHRADIHLDLLQLACALICYRQLAVRSEMSCHPRETPYCPPFAGPGQDRRELQG